MDEDTFTFGSWLKRRRQALRLTQQQLGQLAGCSAETVRKIEADQRRPSDDVTRLLAIPLQIPDADYPTFHRFARGERAEAPELPSLTEPNRPRPLQPPSNLPVPPTPLVGREAEVASVCALLLRNDVRLLTLTGPGGVGKTRLSWAVADAVRDRFVDGTIFVDLSPLSDPALVLATMAQALDVQEMATQPLLQSLQARLRDRQMLLLLDNFEQVLAAGPVVTDLLSVAARLKVLVTSRFPLHLRGERELLITPLSLPGANVRDPYKLRQYDAVRLFVERAQAVKADFQMNNENAPAVAEICNRLDGLPLSIELAAARIKLLPPDALLRRLSHRLPMLVGGQQDLPERQRTLRSTIDWTYHLLAPDEQALFACLAVFVGGCTVEAAEAVFAAAHGQDTNTLEGIESLIDKCLLIPVDSPNAVPRCTMLETIHEYAWEQLTASGRLDALRQHHASYYLWLAEAADQARDSAEQGIWLNRLVTEYSNLRAAFAWSQEQPDRAEFASRLLAALEWFWDRRGAYLTEGQTWIQQVLAHGPADPGPGRYRARALRTLAWMTWYQGDYVRAKTAGEAALACSRELGDDRETGHALLQLGRIARVQGDYAHAHEIEEQSLRAFHTIGDTSGMALALLALGALEREQGRLAAATEHFDAALRIYQELNDANSVAWAKYLLGHTARIAGDYARALRLCMESLELFGRLGSIRGIGTVLLESGRSYQAQGESAQAGTRYTASLRLRMEQGEIVPILECLVAIGGFAAIGGTVEDMRRAARLFGSVEALHHAFGFRLPLDVTEEYEQQVRLVRERLDDTRFVSAQMDGRAMTLEQAVAYAREGMPDA